MGKHTRTTDFIEMHVIPSCTPISKVGMNSNVENNVLTGL